VTNCELTIASLKVLVLLYLTKQSLHWLWYSAMRMGGGPCSVPYVPCFMSMRLYQQHRSLVIAESQPNTFYSFDKIQEKKLWRRKGKVNRLCIPLWSWTSYLAWQLFFMTTHSLRFLYFLSFSTSWSCSSRRDKVGYRELKAQKIKRCYVETWD